MALVRDVHAPCGRRALRARLDRPGSRGPLEPGAAHRLARAHRRDRGAPHLIERDGPRYTFEVSGKFRYGGERTYRATIDAAANCVWHWPATADEAKAATGCEDATPLPGLGPEFPRRPAGGVWPDWFVFRDPHVNYHEGEVLHDDVTLELWR